MRLNPRPSEQELENRPCHEKGGHSIHESLHGLEEMVMSDLTPQVLPEPFNRIELWGIRRQEDQFNFILMSGEPVLFCCYGIRLRTGFVQFATCTHRAAALE